MSEAFPLVQVFLADHGQLELAKQVNKEIGEKNDKLAAQDERIKMLEGLLKEVYGFCYGQGYRGGVFGRITAALEGK